MNVKHPTPSPHPIVCSSRTWDEPIYTYIIWLVSHFELVNTNENIVKQSHRLWDCHDWLWQIWNYESALSLSPGNHTQLSVAEVVWVLAKEGGVHAFNFETGWFAKPWWRFLKCFQHSVTLTTAKFNPCLNRWSTFIHDGSDPMLLGFPSVGAGPVAVWLGAATLRRCEFRLLLRVVASDAATLRLVFA